MKNKTETVKYKIAYDATKKTVIQARPKNRKQDEKKNTWVYS